MNELSIYFDPFNDSIYSANSTKMCFKNESKSKIY